MTISVQDAANIINYLYAAQAITVTDNQHAVWADYINAEMPELHSRDIPVSARRAIKDWSEHGRAWKIDVHQFVRAAKAIRADRVRKRGHIEPPLVLEGDEYGIYQAAYRYAIAGGATNDEANTFAWGEVGRPEEPDPPQIEPTPERIQEILNKARKAKA